MRHIRHIVPTFTEDQIRALLRQPDLSTFTGFRNYTIMCLMLDTGVRIGEQLAVNLQDLVIEIGVPQDGQEELSAVPWKNRGQLFPLL